MSRLSLFFSVFLSFFILFGFVLSKPETQFKNGDIIFISSRSGQGKAIQLATKSKFTHMGIIFIEGGKTMVYHAVEPVSKSTLEEFKNMSEDGKYYTKRLKDQTLLSASVISKMLNEAKSKLGIHYDLVFSWDDKELYCSEFVWKLFNHALSIEVGKPRPLKEFDLTNVAVKAKLKQRYGNNIPLEENMISPGDMYESELLNK